MAQNGEPASPATLSRRNTQDSEASLASGQTGNTANTPRHSKDAFSWMSAEHVEESGHSEQGAAEELSLPPTYPLPLVFFVCLLSIIGGLVVTVVHYAILFAGCPLGINGCNSFSPDKEQYGFFLVDALKNKVPEEAIYIVAAAFGGLIIALMTQWLPKHLAFQISGGGTVQALMAVASGESVMLSAAGVRFLASLTYLATGGTLGMDGAAIQICTSITTFCGWSLGMRAVQTQSLLASLGFAAGFAASFNAPLAGIMFAMEELSHVCLNLSRHMICIILIVSIVATAVSRLFFGNKELFRAEWSGELMQEIGGGSIHKVFGEHMWMLVSVPIAIACSLLGYIMSKLMQKLRAWTLRAQKKMPFTALVVAISTLSAVIGAVVFRITGLRGVWGIGYASLRKAFDQQHSVPEYFIFALGKMAATMLGLAWRAPGDLLEPILIIGAFLGGGFGGVLKEMVDDEFGQRIMQPCLVFGMVAFFASCFRFPLTPVLLVLEVTGVDTYALVLPAALAAFTAVTVSNRLYVPLLEVVMYEDGISLHSLHEDAIIASLSTSADAFHFRSNQDDQEPEPEDEEQGTMSPASETRSIQTAGSQTSASWQVRTVLRGMESSMLALSSSNPPSRSNSSAGASVDPKVKSLLNTLRDDKMRNAGAGKSSNSHSNSRTPSKTSICTPISLALPQSERQTSMDRKGTPSNTSGSIPAVLGTIPSGHTADSLLGIVPDPAHQDSIFISERSIAEQVEPDEDQDAVQGVASKPHNKNGRDADMLE